MMSRSSLAGAVKDRGWLQRAVRPAGTLPRARRPSVPPPTLEPSRNRKKGMPRLTSDALSPAAKTPSIDSLPTAAYTVPKGGSIGKQAGTFGRAAGGDLHNYGVSILPRSLLPAGRSSG